MRIIVVIYVRNKNIHIIIYMLINKINILLIIVIVLTFMIFNIHYKENFEYNKEKLLELKREKYYENENNSEAVNKEIENFYNGYHGGFNTNLPFTVSTVPNALSQTKQFNQNIMNGPPINYPLVHNELYNFPNINLQPQIIGCGSRRGACMGGSQIPIPNTLPPVNISNENIAPINLTMRGFDEGIQQVGIIQKIFGKDNIVYPLFGRKRFRNDNKWDYFVKFGQYGVILPLEPIRNYEELNTNDEVYIQGQTGEYRVTMYDNDIPQYLPFV